MVQLEDDWRLVERLFMQAANEVPQVLSQHIYTAAGCAKNSTLVLQ
jgi:hypothetical protein